MMGMLLAVALSSRSLAVACCSLLCSAEAVRVAAVWSGVSGAGGWRRRYFRRHGYGCHGPAEHAPGECDVGVVAAEKYRVRAER